MLTDVYQVVYLFASIVSEKYHKYKIEYDVNF